MKFYFSVIMSIFMVSHALGNTIVGYQLPAKPSSTTLIIAGQKISTAKLFGHKPILEQILRGSSSQNSFIFDPTCEVLLLPSGSELEAVRLIESKFIPKEALNLKDDQLLIIMNPNDFLKIHQSLDIQTENGKTIFDEKSKKNSNELRSHRDESIENEDCKLNGSLCISKNDLSFSVGCEGKGEITISTSGQVDLQIDGNQISVTVGN